MARWSPVVVACALCLVASLGSAQEEAPRHALILGSSSVNGALGRTLQHELGRMGVEVQRHARSASGFARPDFFDWEQEVVEFGRYNAYEVVFFYAGGNDVQSLHLRDQERPSPSERWIRWDDADRWTQLYATRVRSLVDLLCDRGARRVVVLLPVDGGRGGQWARRLDRVREAQRTGARESVCGQPLDANDGTPFDSHDGVHLNRSGARRWWRIIRHTVRDLFVHPGARGA